jgi:hypothetical protein
VQQSLFLLLFLYTKKYGYAGAFRIKGYLERDYGIYRVLAANECDKGKKGQLALASERRHA